MKKNALHPQASHNLIKGHIFTQKYVQIDWFSEPTVYSNTISKNCPPAGYSRVNKDCDKFVNPKGVVKKKDSKKFVLKRENSPQFA